MVRSLLLIAAGALWASVNAITITSPPNNATWDTVGGPRTVSWTSVSTDPSTFNIWIGKEPNLTEVAQNVTTSLGTYQIPGTLPVGTGTVVRFTSDDGGILAESQSFTILSATGTLPATTASATATSSNGASASSSSGAHSGAEGRVHGSMVAMGVAAGIAVALGAYLA